MMVAGSYRFRRWLGTLGTLFVAVAVVYIVARSLQGNYNIGDAVFFVLPGCLSAALGYLVVTRRPENRIGLLLVGIGVTATLLGLGEAIFYGLSDDRSLALGFMGSDIFFVITFVQVFVLLPLWFPTGKALSPFWAWVARVGLGLAVITALGAFFGAEICIAYPPAGGECVSYTTNPLGIGAVPADLADITFLPLMLTGLFGLVGLIVRFRRSEGIERLQMKWLVLAVSFLVFVFALSIEPIRIGVGLNDTILLGVLLGLAYSSIPIACGLAVLKYRLYEIDRIISRTVSYALVVGLLVAVFSGVVTLTTSLLQVESDLAVAASTLAVAALFNPLRKRVQGWVDRRFNRSKYDHERVMDEFTGSLRDRVDPDGVVEGWVGVVTETMQPSAVSVWVKE